MSPRVDDIGALTDLGVDELVLVESPPDSPDAVAGWVAALADKWLPPMRVGKLPN